MVSWTIPLTYIMEKIQIAIYSLTNPSHTANSHPSYLLIVLQKILFRKKKKKTYCHDNDKKYFRNNIICGSFYQRYSLILPSLSKWRHDFLHVISIKKVASLLYPSLSCKVSYLALTFDSYFSFLYEITISFWLITFMQFNCFSYNVVLISVIKFNSSLTF